MRKLIVNFVQDDLWDGFLPVEDETLIGGTSFQFRAARDAQDEELVEVVRQRLQQDRGYHGDLSQLQLIRKD